MKKTFTYLAIILFCGSLNAQISPIKVKNGNISSKAPLNMIGGNEALSNLITNPNPNTVALKATNTIDDVRIGTTTYDLQSNASVDNRLIRHSNGTISATWTMSAQFAAAYSDRGTGYNFHDGSSWGPDPTSRLESSRGGWPSVLATGSGKEIAITHNTDNGYLLMTHRPSVGAGTWTEQIISSMDSNGVYTDIIWNRAVIGGSNNETIHMVGVIAPTGLGGAIWNGLDGALVYYRSQDGGDTWDIQDMQLPTLDTSKYNGFDGDGYAIAAQGETVVVAYFGDLDDSVLLKSTDNGNTWTSTVFLDFPVDNYTTDAGIDLDGDGVMDSLYSTDGAGTVLLDDNGDAHVFFGNMRLLDADLSDGNTSYFGGTSGIMYWNESMGADDYANNPISSPSLWYSSLPQMIAAAQDLDGDGILNYVGIPTYYLSLDCMPSAGIDNQGNIFVSYSSLMENVDNGSQNFRHVHVVKSIDGGTTWSNPKDVTEWSAWGGAQECVFGRMDRNVDDKIRLIYQKDFEPGLAVRGDEDIIDMNEIRYLELDTFELSGTSTNIANNSLNIEFSVYPNPAKNNLTVEFYSDNYEKTTFTLNDILGKRIKDYTFNTITGKNRVNLDLNNLKNGVYLINFNNNDIKSTQKLIISK
tara:strand:+ start:2250 stop:4166 length:1917 start_codon:yes stop_codon:yes gene_type:complete